MKYIKAYEGRMIVESKYKVDDYVYLNDHRFPFGKIIEVIYPTIGNTTIEYLIEAYVVANDVYRQGYISEYTILRHLTPEEIEIFETHKDTNKYNL